MDRVHDAIEWYQKKIGSYDKQLWEQSVEKKLQKQPSFILHNAPRRKVRIKTEFIDVDLIRGSTFTKTKPQVPWVYVTKKALARVLFFPFYYSWWIHQTSCSLYTLLLCLYVLQVASIAVYITTEDNVLDEELSFTEVILPMILMFLLCLIHSQTVLAHITHKPPKHSKTISGVTRKPRPKLKKSVRKGRNSEGNSTCPEDGCQNKTSKQPHHHLHQQHQQQYRHQQEEEEKKEFKTDSSRPTTISPSSISSSSTCTRKPHVLQATVTGREVTVEGKRKIHTDNDNTDGYWDCSRLVEVCEEKRIAENNAQITTECGGGGHGSSHAQLSTWSDGFGHCSCALLGNLPSDDLSVQPGALLTANSTDMSPSHVFSAVEEHTQVVRKGRGEESTKTGEGSATLDSRLDLELHSEEMNETSGKCRYKPNRQDVTDGRVGIGRRQCEARQRSYTGKRSSSFHQLNGNSCHRRREEVLDNSQKCPSAPVGSRDLERLAPQTERTQHRLSSDKDFATVPTGRLQDTLGSLDSGLMSESPCQSSLQSQHGSLENRQSLEKLANGIDRQSKDEHLGIGQGCDDDEILPFVKESELGSALSPSGTVTSVSNACCIDSAWNSNCEGVTISDNTTEGSDLPSSIVPGAIVTNGPEPNVSHAVAETKDCTEDRSELPPSTTAKQQSPLDRGKVEVFALRLAEKVITTATLMVSDRATLIMATSAQRCSMPSVAATPAPVSSEGPDGSFRPPSELSRSLLSLSSSQSSSLSWSLSSAEQDGKRGGPHSASPTLSKDPSSPTASNCDSLNVLSREGFPKHISTTSRHQYLVKGRKSFHPATGHSRKPDDIEYTMEECHTSDVDDDDDNDDSCIAHLDDDDADVDDDGEDDGGVLSDLSSHKGSESEGEKDGHQLTGPLMSKQLRFQEREADGLGSKSPAHTCTCGTSSSPTPTLPNPKPVLPASAKGSCNLSPSSVSHQASSALLTATTGLTKSGSPQGSRGLSVVSLLTRKLAPLRHLGLGRSRKPCQVSSDPLVSATSSASDLEEVHRQSSQPTSVNASITSCQRQQQQQQQQQQPQQQPPILRRRRRVSANSPAAAVTLDTTKSEPGVTTTGHSGAVSSGSGGGCRSLPNSLGLRAPRESVRSNKEGDKMASSSENEIPGGQTPEGSNKAAVSSEEWEDRIQTDETTSSAYSSSCGNSAEEEDGEERTEYTTSTLHVINLLQPQGGSPSNSGGNVTQSDRVSCLIWEGNECKKVDLTALDIGWAIIDKVDNMPESSDYFLIGLLFSFIIAVIPLVFRTYVSKIEVPWTELSSAAGLMSMLEGAPSQLYAVYSWRQWLLLANSILQRFFLSLIFFFLLSVADRTFKQRLLYAKHFSYLTSSRRARKFTMPHFRLSKVRNIKIWLSLRSYLKRRGPQRSVDVIVSACFMCAICTVSLISLQMLKDSESFTECLCNWELLVWCCGLAVFLMRFMTLGLKINKKYRNLSVLITEQINLYLQMEQKPHKKDELLLANNVLRLAEDLLKELESPFKISGFSANPVIYNIMRVVVLSALSAVLTEVLGFKLKLHKIKLKG